MSLTPPGTASRRSPVVGRVGPVFLVAFSSLLACGPSAPPSPAAVAEPLVYGADDRREVFECPDARLRELATASTAALIEPSELRFPASGMVEFHSATLSEWDDYCEGTPFLDEPTSASCAGVLIDDDLLLTADHCLRMVSSCRDLAFVFGYAYSERSVLGPVTRADVFGCRGVAVSSLSADGSGKRVDFAIVQLDRSATASGSGRAPARVAAARALDAGEPVTIVGHPSGLPAKIDEGAKVVDPHANVLDAFTMTSDTFHGSSGSPVYDSTDSVIGVFSEGTADFVDRGSCRAVRTLPGDAGLSNEWATYAAPAVAALCAAGFPSLRLCGIAARCGDDICTGGVEDHQTCARDCPAPVCGDHLCEEAEWSSCPADCGDLRPATLPDAWFCEPAWYGSGGDCNCRCGAPDPDCNGGARACNRYGPGALEAKTGSPGSGSCALRRLSRSGGAAEIALLLAGLALARARRGRASATHRARGC